jgi:hypothetical protein
MKACIGKRAAEIPVCNHGCLEIFARLKSVESQHPTREACDCHSLIPSMIPADMLNVHNMILLVGSWVICQDVDHCRNVTLCGVTEHFQFLMCSERVSQDGEEGRTCKQNEIDYFECNFH